MKDNISGYHTLPSYDVKDKFRVLICTFLERNDIYLCTESFN